MLQKIQNIHLAIVHDHFQEQEKDRVLAYVRKEKKSEVDEFELLILNSGHQHEVVVHH